ncbi:MAG: hypothetical protein JWO73_818 [Candidatus Taylorbacteria bacterium]|nr:hypothetical protein [Candidatus Taylorbacteria bacterium]
MPCNSLIKRITNSDEVLEQQSFYKGGAGNVQFQPPDFQQRPLKIEPQPPKKPFYLRTGTAKK